MRTKLELEAVFSKLLFNSGGVDLPPRFKDASQPGSQFPLRANGSRCATPNYLPLHDRYQRQDWVLPRNELGFAGYYYHFEKPVRRQHNRLYPHCPRNPALLQVPSDCGCSALPAICSGVPSRHDVPAAVPALRPHVDDQSTSFDNIPRLCSR